MATLPATKVLTYEDYLRTPEMKKRYEIIDGVMEMMSPAPSIKHQLTVGELYSLMKNAARGHGKVVTAPCDIIISRRPLRTRQPDLLFVRQEHLHIMEKDQFEEGPDLVVEILSPSNTRKAILEKLADYARIGVEECWMINIENRTLEVWRNQRGHFRPATAFRVGQKVGSRVFPAFPLAATVFPF